MVCIHKDQHILLTNLVTLHKKTIKNFYSYLFIYFYSKGNCMHKRSIYFIHMYKWGWFFTICTADSNLTMQVHKRWEGQIEVVELYLHIFNFLGELYSAKLEWFNNLNCFIVWWVTSVNNENYSPICMEFV